MFLRVIFLLILQDNPMLVTGALKLLFRHFNQRQELVTALKNVQAGYKSNLSLNYCRVIRLMYSIIFVTK